MDEKKRNREPFLVMSRLTKKAALVFKKILNSLDIKITVRSDYEIPANELLPCPFCAGNPHISGSYGWEIVCRCGVSVTIMENDKEVLISRWNSRACINASKISEIETHKVPLDDQVPRLNGTQEVLNHVHPRK